MWLSRVLVWVCTGWRLLVLRRLRSVGSTVLPAERCGRYCRRTEIALEVMLPYWADREVSMSFLHLSSPAVS